MILSKFLGPNWEADPDLDQPLKRVDSYFTSESPQHELRRWEYAMALLAYYEWLPAYHKTIYRMLDVGGAGSPFKNMFLASKREVLEVIDPEINYPVEKSPLTPPASAIFSISVLEHTEDPYDFLEACARRLGKGGLLFLTVDAWDPPIENAPDTAHFHWMRKRIFTKTSINHMMETLCEWGFEPFGEIDLEYKSNMLYGLGETGYTFASISMRKEK